MIVNTPRAHEGIRGGPLPCARVRCEDQTAKTSRFARNSREEDENRNGAFPGQWVKKKQLRNTGVWEIRTCPGSICARGLSGITCFSSIQACGFIGTI